MKIDKSQTNRWRIMPKVTYTNFRKEYPNMGADCFSQWFCVERFWSGRIIDIRIKHHQLSFDFRKNWMADFCFSKPE